MKKMAGFFVLLLSLNNAAHAGIFGADDRQFVRPFTPMAKLGDSISMAIQNYMSESSTPNTRSILVEPYPLCPGEKFATAPTFIGSCVGFLVAPDVMATVGHCSTGVNTEIHDRPASEVAHCDSYEFWLFGYQVRQNGQAQTEKIPQDRFFKCKKVIYAINDEHDSGRDFALIQLDRPVEGRPILKFAKESPKVGEAVFAIGHPMGMPQILGKGRVMTNSPNKTYIETNIDAIDGNSGSPVFNSRHEVIGLISAGGPAVSWIEDKKRQCFRFAKCKDDGTQCNSERPEIGPVRTDVVRIEALQKKLEAYLQSKSQ